MTISQLIDRLQECGDQKFRDTAEVVIEDEKGEVMGDAIDIFDVKDGVNCVAIRIPHPY